MTPKVIVVRAVWQRPPSGYFMVVSLLFEVGSLLHIYSVLHNKVDLQQYITFTFLAFLNCDRCLQILK